jgi:hypothetical protein
MAQMAETQRILQVKVRTGTLGKLDRTDTRAAVLLAHTMRLASQQIPWKELAAAVSVKHVSALQEFQQLLHYLQPPQQVVNADNNKNQGPKQQQSIVRRSSRGWASIIPELSLWLAGHLQDPHGVGQASITLFTRFKTCAVPKIAQGSIPRNVGIIYLMSNGIDLPSGTRGNQQ